VISALGLVIFIAVTKGLGRMLNTFARRLSENEKFVARSRKTKILTAGIHWVF